MKKIAAIILILCLSSTNLHAMEEVIRPAIQSTFELGVSHPKIAATISVASSAASVYCFEMAMASNSPLVTIGGVGSSFALSLGAIAVCPSKNSLNGLITGTLFFSMFCSKLIPKSGSPITRFFTNTICAALFNYSIKQILINSLSGMGDAAHVWDIHRKADSTLEEEEE